MQNGSGSNGAAAPAPKGGGGSKQAIEKMYQKKSQLEHILLRPDTYIGSVERVQEQMWVVNQTENEGKTSYDMVQREISFVPGLYKIFDEILVNAAGKTINITKLK
jgi:DNA topoisomerase II